MAKFIKLQGHYINLDRVTFIEEESDDNGMSINLRFWFDQNPNLGKGDGYASFSCDEETDAFLEWLDTQADKNFRIETEDEPA